MVAHPTRPKTAVSDTCDFERKNGREVNSLVAQRGWSFGEEVPTEWEWEEERMSASEIRRTLTQTLLHIVITPARMEMTATDVDMAGRRSGKADVTRGGGEREKAGGEGDYDGERERNAGLVAEKGVERERGCQSREGAAACEGAREGGGREGRGKGGEAGTEEGSREGEWGAQAETERRGEQSGSDNVRLTQDLYLKAIRGVEVKARTTSFFKNTLDVASSFSRPSFEKAILSPKGLAVRSLSKASRRSNREKRYVFRIISSSFFSASRCSSFCSSIRPTDLRHDHFRPQFRPSRGS
ncbi:hypothetical protein ACLOJK_026454 [Asimina triloba]